MIYLTLFLIGLCGLMIQMLLGLVHVGDGNDHGGHADAGQGLLGHGHGLHIGHGHADHGGHMHGPAGHGDHGDAGNGHGDHDQSHHQEGQNGRSLSALWTLLSPMTLFSLCLGIGATGMLLSPLRLPGLMVASLAGVGGVAFFALGVRPLARLIYGFASKPSKGLASAISNTAEAVTRFDSSGKGLVRLTVDGHIVQVLAMLETDERDEASAIAPGDTLTVTSVDGKTNTCRVTRL